MAAADPRLVALGSSVRRLRDLAAACTEADLTSPAYPSEWTVADVLSHLGSGATIMGQRLEDELRGRSTPDDFAPGVWAAWNAKSPTAQREDALAADELLQQRLDGTGDDERAGLAIALGPMSLDFGAFVGMRLNEHAFHTWDIEVAGDPAATLAPDATACVIDNLALIVGYTAKPTGADAVVHVATEHPARRFRLTLTADAATMVDDDTGPADLTLPAEAFARLVYGRLDPGHTPGFTGDPELLDQLRRTFPGP